MTGFRLAAWNPSDTEQFALYGNQLELWKIANTSGVGRIAASVGFSKLASHVSCMDWQKLEQHALLAFGSTSGSIGLIRWSENGNQEVFLQESTSSIKRACCGMAWNFVIADHLATCIENYKNESTVVLWDVSAATMLKLPIVESVSTISFLPHSPHLIGVGTSMGWAKVFDTRLPSSPVLSWLPHPSNRPRKIQGMRSDLLSSHYMATFSDASGDVVKVWDLRYLAESHLSKSKPAPIVSVSPNYPTTLTTSEAIGSFSYPVAGIERSPSGLTPAATTSNTAVIQDAAWSPTRAGLLAVATSAQKAIAFFKCDRSASPPLDELQPSTPTPSVSLPVLTQPAFVINTGDAVRSLSWQLHGLLHQLRVESNVLESSGVGVIPVHQSQASSSDSSALRWDQFDTSTAVSDFMSGQPSTSQTASHGGAESHRILATTLNAVVDSDVREASAAMAVCAQHVLSTPEDMIHIHRLDVKVTIPLSGSGEREKDGTALRARSRSSSEARGMGGRLSAIEEIISSVVMEVDSLMQDRARAGYSTDTSINLDILTEEVDALYRHLQLAWLHSPLASPEVSQASYTSPPYFVAKSQASRKEVETGVLGVGHIQELYRVWLWLDRVISDLAYKKAGTALPFHLCGVSTILREVERETDAKIKHSLLGIKYYTSKQRSAVHQVCGWISALEASHARLAHSSGSSGGGAGGGSGGAGGGAAGSVGHYPSEANSIRSFLEEEQTSACFERIVALAIWHGHMDLAVMVLTQVIDQFGSYDTSPAHTAREGQASGSHTRTTSAANLKSGATSPKRAQRQSSPRNMDSTLLDGGEGGDLPQGGLSSSPQDGLLLEDYDPEQAVDWDHVITGDYVSILATVAACFAGYHLDPDRITSPEHRPSHTWITMCKYVIAQLQTVPRVHSHYLICACYFLMMYLDPHNTLCYDYFDDQLSAQRRSLSPFHEKHLRAAGASNAQDSSRAQAQSMLQDHDALLLHAGHQLILYNPWIYLDDRLAFAARYLDSSELAQYVDYMSVYSACHGALEGLMITGFTSDAYSILQQYVERSEDLQSVALIVSSFVAFYNNPNVWTAMPSAANAITANASASTAAVATHPSASRNPPQASTAGQSTAVSKSTKKDRSAAPHPASQGVSKSLVQRSHEWILAYRRLLNTWKMYVERAHLDIELNVLTKTYSASSSAASASSLVAANAPSNANPNSVGGAAEKGDSKQQAINQEYKLASSLLESQRCSVRLKCRFCTKMLPLEEFPMSGLDTVRNQKNVLNYCNHCKNALPRCYICQLHLGLLNPYVHALRLSDQYYRESRSRQELPCDGVKRIAGSAGPSTTPSASNLSANSTAMLGKAGGAAGATGTGGSTAGLKEEGAYSGLDFGRWVLFCQHCRHGGHAICLTSWFNGSAGVTEHAEIEKMPQNARVVCGVNGCSCHCQLYS